MSVPVVALRFPHDSIASRLHFRNQQSIFKTSDELQRGTITACELEEPLDVCVHDGNLYGMSNRRLFVLLMYQAVRHDWPVSAPYILRTKDWRSNAFKKH